MQDDNQNNQIPPSPAEPPVSISGQTTQLPGDQPAPTPAPAGPTPGASVAPRQKKEGGIFSFILTLIVAFILVQIINMFLFQSYKVFGSSMVPTLHEGDRLIISKVGKTSARIRGKTYEPKRGDIIVFIDPQQPDLQLIKRVIGLPGERVVVKNGSITVYNGDFPGGFNPDKSGLYSADLPETSGSADVTVPKGQLFVSGDNREGSNSLDSRNELGTVPEELVIGTLQVRLWPFGDAKFF